MNFSSLQDFQIQKKLGQGVFSCVYKVLRRSDGQEYAMKKVRMSGLTSKEKQNSLNEVRILASIQSSYIVGYKEAFFDAQENCLFIILEYVSGGDLQSKISYVKKKGLGFYFDEEIIWTYLIYMLQGLNILHRNNIFHRDVKCANIFLTKDHKQLKLGDLNVAKVVKTDTFAQTLAGTPYYASPEVWKDQPYDGRCDIWSLGCVIYEMAALQHPFQAQDLESLQRKVGHGVYEQIHCRYTKDLTKVINNCLQVNPKNRVTSDELLQSKEIQSRLHYDRYIMTKMKSIHQDLANDQTQLLNTILIPRNMKDLQDILPKQNYDYFGDSQNNLCNSELTTKNECLFEPLKQFLRPIIRQKVSGHSIPRYIDDPLKRSTSQMLIRDQQDKNNENQYGLQIPPRANKQSLISQRSDYSLSQVRNELKNNKPLNEIHNFQLNEANKSPLLLPSLKQFHNKNSWEELQPHLKKHVKKPSQYQIDMGNDKSKISSPMNKILKRGHHNIENVMAPHQKHLKKLL